MSHDLPHILAPDTSSPADPVGDPLEALAGAGGVLAVITGVEGPHYRNPGAVMSFPALGDGRLGAVGQLSSGCIEADLALHAAEVWHDGAGQQLRYGLGSPFVDLRLPCGGGLDVALIAVRDPAPLRAALDLRTARRSAWLDLDLGNGGSGGIAVGETRPASAPGRFALAVRPPPAFAVLGVGVEALTFAALAHAAGYPVTLSSPDAATRTAARRAGTPLAPPGPLVADARTAVTLFFHDHEVEPALLAEALRSEAFYIGAQGSLRTHQRRLAALAELGLTPAETARLRGPIGLIPSARDPRVLAVSVLAEVLGEALSAAPA